MCHGGCFKCSFSFSSYSYNDTLDSKSFHTYFAQNFANETTIFTRLACRISRFEMFDNNKNFFLSLILFLQIKAIARKGRGKSKKESNGNRETSMKYSGNFHDSIDSFQESICMSGSPDQPGPSTYSTHQTQELNQLYEQNYAHLRQIFNMVEIQKAMKGIIHLADHIRKDDEDNNVIIY